MTSAPVTSAPMTGAQPDWGNELTTQLWWIIHKDLVCEFRTRLVWPRMVLLGLIVAYLLNHQMNLRPDELRHITGSLCWLTICFAAVLTLGQSGASEREEGCWEGLILYPVAPHTIYFAKLIVNAILLGALQLIVVPLFLLLSHTPLLAHPWEILLVSLLGNLGVTSIGTLLGAMTSGIRQSQSLLALLLLPLLVPVILAASEATRLIVEYHVASEWWFWVQLLGGFAIVHIAAGFILFEFVIEE